MIKILGFYFNYVSYRFHCLAKHAYDKYRKSAEDIISTKETTVGEQSRCHKECHCVHNADAVAVVEDYPVRMHKLVMLYVQ